MAKYVIGIIIIIILAASGAYLLSRGKTAPQNNAPVVQQAATSTYATTTFSVVYPADFMVDEAYAYQGVPNKPVPGVKFVIPGTMATGTNLSSDSGVSIESLPRAKKCTGDIYFYDNVRAESVNINGVVYSVASTTGAGAGNVYEETVYALSGSSPCTAVRYFIHYGNIGNYEPGAVREFDRTALLAEFDKIRDSLKLNTATPGVTP